MDQKKVGKFIAELRRQSDMTQRELAGIVGVSDKTISKWECGNSMPDISYLPSIGEALGVSVNELLSGERLSQEAYSSKAEENIMNLMKENAAAKKSGKAGFIVGIILIIMAIFMAMASIESDNRILAALAGIEYFVDLPALLFLALLSVGEILAVGVRGAKNIAHFLRKVTPGNGALIFFISIVQVMRLITSPEVLGPNLAVAILSCIYAAIIYLAATMVELILINKENVTKSKGAE